MVDGQVPKLLKRLREAKGWTQSQAAAAASANLRTYHGWEQGRRKPGVSSIRNIMMALGCTFEELTAAIAADEKLEEEERRNPRRDWPPYAVALLGRAGAGGPVNDEPDLSQFIDLGYLHEDDVFFVQIRGDSMVNRHIVDGDYIAVKAVAEAQPGDLVVVWGDEGHLLKKLVRKGERLYLESLDGTATRWAFDSESDRLVGVYLSAHRLENKTRRRGQK